MSKRESKGEQTRRTIVSRALGIVSDVGYEGLFIGALAEESKLFKSGLFAHFKSKEALQLGVIAAITLSGIELAHRIRKRQFSFGPGGQRRNWSLKQFWDRPLA